MKNKNGQILLALFTGAAIGAGLGILYAPNRGRDTRKKIKHSVTDTTHDVSEWVKNAKNDLAQTAHEKKEFFEKKLDNALYAMSNKAQDIISKVEDKFEEIKNKSAQS